MQPLEEGQKFERYRIQHKLGSGISGDSYEAEDIRLQRKVTLKLIHPWLPLPDAARRQFFREMQDISTLTHPYLATLLDYGEVGGQLYVARRFVGPGSLLGSEGRRWFQPPLPIIEAIRLAHQLAQTLQYVHNSGLLHGSLTLTNILVLHGLASQSQDLSAPLLLADIGIAHFVRRFGQPKMTLLPITAAPEQLGKRSTPASDQYALAVMLYFWLAGQLPFLGSPEDIEQLKLTETIPPLTRHNASITAEQEEIIRRALSVYPEERHPSIIAFTDALLISLIKSAQEKILSRSLPLSTPPDEPAIETYQPAASQPPVPPSSLKAEQEASPELNSHGEARKEPAADLPAPSSLNGSVSETGSHNHHAHSAATPEPASSSIGSPCFVIASPYTTGFCKVAIEQEETTLGRAGSSNILLDFDDQTSRHHALLKHEEDHYVLYDRRSISGTFVNGQEISNEQGCVLADGDIIKIGVYELVFHLKESA
ncbi:MAG TPA: FHA domain-containing serine/threonine-protein kinase [Ktedonosporobacter sp.]|jgi:serine/threonine protein kinase|nr:FHA domain-containing serine/threonine-protein kinase [Ktedonosporobacter sp.]